ncbi:alkylation response protein AidB-like acyl-CoA dehydrogenase [Rhodococcus sp. SMB37]|uniref:acyl-CoA dehydrogenase family protein n=1 Tax=Rhodococcus sp. SMB37 TaxID=2512213 RepID=UPI0006D07E24|nr:acyl-CoA dehydrogenase family protein [Rhodococcus sp. SMB37]TCN58310.1 alkylation response protein AidB-like acyl-CoA dehydrogenase [Rhodococcus sp. SMB37]
MTDSLPDLSEFHDELRSVARGLLARSGHDAPVDWESISTSGWLGLEVPSEFDGADGTFAEVAVILREIGRASARGPYPAVASLTVAALALLESGPERERLLRDTASGSTVPVFVLGGESAGRAQFQVEVEPQGAFLRGAAAFVLDAPGADRLLVPAREPDGTIVVIDLDPRAPGLVVTEQPVVDATRSFGTVLAEGVAIPPESLWRFHGDPQEALHRLHDRAAVGVACDSLGSSEAMLDATVAYAGMREQFGRKIGSFQAVKHACADMLVQVTVARTLVDAAVRSLVSEDPEATTATSMAKVYSCAAAVEIAGKAMQLHGGMGYTWESGIHVYLKRATLNRSLFGSPALHRAYLAQRYRPAS